MGQVQSGGRKEVAFSVTNPSDTPIAVTRIETTCKCLTIELPNHLLAAGEKITGRAQLDLSAEPEFRGRLGIKAEGVGESGKVVLAIVVNAHVTFRDLEQKGRIPALSDN